MKDVPLVICVFMSTVACASSVHVPPPAADHPGNPHARPAAPLVITALAPEAADTATKRTTPGSPASKQGVGSSPHDHERRSGEAKDGAAEPKPFVCPMHPDVRDAEPGRCPRCGMVLLEKDTHP